MCTPECICEKLGGLAFDEVIRAGKYVRHYTENLQKLKDKLKDLDDCMEIITREVSVADGRGDEIEVNVLHWQTDANKFKADVEKLMGESTTKASISCIACSCPNIVWRYKFSKQAEEKMADADALIGKFNNFNHQISHPSSHYMENHQKLKDKLRDLGNCREIIRRKVSEANGRGDEIEVNVSQWQTDADSLLDNIEQLIRKSTYMCSTECPCPDITWQYKFSKQAEEKIADADGLIIKYNNFNQISHPRPRPPELESLSDKNYVKFNSRASIFKDIMDALQDSNVNMVGVFGLGGVGKTTLVKEVGEQMRKDGTFKQVAMAVVSKDLNVKEVQSRLAGSLNFKFKAEADDQDGRAIELWNKFTNGDKYLIILDDIWKEVKMEEIGIPCTNEKKGCKVVLTSRKEDLLRITMKADKKFRIGELSEAEAMDLFKKKVGKTIESQPKIDSIAQEVCRKCKGLPVAINAIGAALEDKPYRTWKNALDKLERHMLTQIEGVDPSVWASLYVSYDMLRSPDAQSHSRSSDAQSRSDAQSCFLLCCLFHEDAEIPIDELTRLCIARSLLAQNPFTLDEARNAVHTVVDALKSASLLTTGSHENVVRIHDVIRDVGISIARDQDEEFLIDHGAPQWPPIPTNAPSYSAISLAFKDIKRLPSGLEYPQLHTLIVENSELSDVEFPNNFFNGMTQLSVLEITTMRMRRLPSSLAKLAKLRMLYLDGCELADIALLKHLKSNLEVLGIRRSSIEALPVEIGQLTSLRVLDLKDCDELSVIPRGVISNLTGLEELYFPFEFAEWKATIDEQQDTSNRDNVSLEDLRRLLNDGQLTTLQIHIPDVKLLPNDELIFANLKGFKISVGSKFDYWEGKLSTPRTCMLKAEGVQLRTEFISLVDEAEVLVLKGIQLTVYPFRLSNKLTVLTIEGLELKYLFTPTTAKELVHLEKLEVNSCEIMEGIVGFEGQKDENEITGEVKFSKLKQLKLTSLPNLISFFAKKEEMGTTMGSFSTRAHPLFNEQVIFPVLERLTIDGLGSIIKIWDKHLVAIWQEQGSFCQLTDLKVRHCNKLMHVFPSNMHPLLKNLKELEVRECETMKGIAEFEGERDEDGVRNEVASPAREHLEMVGVTEIQDKQSLPEPKEEFESLCRPVNKDDIIVFPRLKEVTLWYLPELKSFYSETQGFFSHKVAFPVLERLSFWSLDKITRIWDKQPHSELEKKDKSFCQLMKIDVYYCQQLEYVLPSYMLPQLENLEKLGIHKCRKMEVIISNNPQEKEAANNNDTIRFRQLKTLQLEDLPNLKSFICSDETQLLFSNKVAFPVLENLIFWSFDKITRIWDNQPLSEPEKEAKSFSELKIINVGRCEHLEYVFPFYMLPQLKNLQDLRIHNCTRVEVIISNNLKEKEATNNNDIIQFPQLKTLELNDLPNFKSFICSHETQVFFSNKVIFPVLKKLSILKMNKIIEIWDKQSTAVLEEQGFFCQLTDLDVSECEKLMHVFHSKMHLPLKNLKVLCVSDCPTMEGIVEFEGEIDEDGLRNEVCFSELSSLELSSLPNLKSFCAKLGKAGTTEGNSTIHALPLFNGKVAFPVLESLDFKNLSKITRIWDEQPLSEQEKEAKSFCKLMVIKVEDCDQLEYVLPSYALPQFINNLQNLTISGCTKMEVIISNNPKEKEAANNTDAILFPQLKEVRLWGLPNLKSFICIDETQLLFSNKVIFPVLKKLSIQKVHKIIEIWDKQSIAISEEQGSFCRLKDLEVSECEKLMHVFPSKMHSPLKNLKVLRVSDCPTMEGIIQFEGEIDEDGLRNYELCFSKLSSLELSGLANLESFCTKLEKAGTTEGNSIIHALPLFNRKVAFPVLETLKFRDLHKITRIWDNQLLSEREQEAKSFCKLKEITVEDCDQLEYVLPLYMLPQLKNLEELDVERCRKMEVIISNNPQEKEATNNNDTIRFPRLKEVLLVGLPNLKSFICSDETQLFFSNKVTFPVLEIFVLAELDKITRIWNNQPLSEQEKEAKSFSKLKSIYVVRCEHLEYVLPFYMLSQLKNLQELWIRECRKMEVIISNNPKEKEATNNNDTIRFPQLKEVKLKDLPNLKSFMRSETQLLFSDKDAFPVLEKIKLRPRGTLEFLGNGTSTEDETSTEDDTMEEWSTSNEESDHSGEKLDEDSETPTTEVSMEECSTSGEESDHNGEELDEDLETPTKEDCNTSGEESDHNGEELDEDLETPMKEGCGTSGKQNDHNGEQG